ncbi:hypothetical protein AAE478_008417 [Parahypoxylon ruwenzoriense]
MSCCMPMCHHAPRDGARTKLNHDKNTNPGTTFYYCSMHRVYHCIAQKEHRRLQQPSCGECAWLFFNFPKEAAKYPNSDIPAIDARHPDDPLRKSAAGCKTGHDCAFEDGGKSLGVSCTALANKVPPPALEETLNNLSERIHRRGKARSNSGDKRGSGSDQSGARLMEMHGVVVEVDADGDVIMQEAPHREPRLVVTPPPTPAPTPIPSPTIVQLPIRRRNWEDSFLQFIPYDNPAVFDVRPWQWHPKLSNIFLFRYTDFNGRPAVQPAADERHIRAYFEPLVSEEERAGCDRLLLEARWWCCYVQGFTHLEPELRWVLTLIFDLVGVVIEKQRMAATLTQ